MWYAYTIISTKFFQDLNKAGLVRVCDENWHFWKIWNRGTGRLFLLQLGAVHNLYIYETILNELNVYFLVSYMIWMELEYE